MELSDGLEEIGEEAFRECTSMHAIVIPPFVKKIPKWEGRTLLEAWHKVSCYILVRS
jgi:hypothetical protein